MVFFQWYDFSLYLSLFFTTIIDFFNVQKIINLAQNIT